MLMGRARLADAVRRETPQTDFASTLKDVVDGEVAFENEVLAVLDLCNRIAYRAAFLV